jgi:small subunit ribosomal protein S1
MTGDIQELEEVNPTIAEGGVVNESRSNDYEKLWQNLSDLKEKGEKISVLVIDAGKGGLEVSMGVRAFVPRSQIATKNLNNLERYIGQTIDVKITEVNREDGRVILSERIVADEIAKIEREETLSKLKPGQILTGKVVRIKEFGAFVNIGGVDGLLHIGDMTWEHIEKPEEAVKLGDELELKVLKIEQKKDDYRISLGLKQLTDDPWIVARNEYGEGTSVEVEIVRLATLGAIVRLMKGVEGLIPNEELYEHRNVTEEDRVQVGQKVTAKITEFRVREHKLTMSVRSAIRDRERGQVRDFMKEQTAANMKPTLGDLFGDVLNKFKKED